MIAVLVTDPTQNRQQVTITTGIPSGLTIPELMNSISTGALDATKMITHRMAVDDTEEATTSSSGPPKPVRSKLF